MNISDFFAEMTSAPGTDLHHYGPWRFSMGLGQFSLLDPLSQTFYRVTSNPLSHLPGLDHVPAWSVAPECWHDPVSYRVNYTYPQGPTMMWEDLYLPVPGIEGQILARRGFFVGNPNQIVLTVLQCNDKYELIEDYSHQIGAMHEQGRRPAVMGETSVIVSCPFPGATAAFAAHLQEIFPQRPRGRVLEFRQAKSKQGHAP